MKRLLTFLLTAVFATLMCNASISTSRVRKETRFLTDRMAYELHLTGGQYNDVYEINYDFIYGIRYLMDDVLDGQEWALDRYYYLLDLRNDDLRWVLSHRQYADFIGLDRYYRPVYVNAGRWQLRVYLHFTNHSHFYFPKPYHYKSYNGGHHRVHFADHSFYSGKYNHSVYTGHFKLHGGRDIDLHRKHDFESVKIKPNTSRRPSSSSSNKTTTNASSSRRPSSSSSSKTTTSASSSRRPSSSSSSNKATTSKSSSRRSSSTSSSSTSTSASSKRSAARQSVGETKRESGATGRTAGSSSRKVTDATK